MGSLRMAGCLKNRQLNHYRLLSKWLKNYWGIENDKGPAVSGPGKGQAGQGTAGPGWSRPARARPGQRLGQAAEGRAGRGFAILWF